MQFTAGEDLEKRQIAQFNEADGKFYAYDPESPSGYILVIFEDVKKDQVIKREMKRD